ncbi:MAG: hypothetical protein JO267_04795 [Alphaproteobacteria bacterium]|nr:hypothetical protein [Alphaproteobacteria bacterium]MBV9861448.1 hypothetical protein [Alphaproteobacteria bacterium]
MDLQPPFPAAADKPEQPSEWRPSPDGAAARGVAWTRLLPSWPLLIGLFGLARALAAGRAVLNDPDTYLHIAAGRWMLAHRALPLHDPFSHTMAGAAWAPSEWLAELVIAITYGAGGWSALVVLGAVCFAAALAILTRLLLRRLDPLCALVAAGAAAALLLPHLLMRPHALALPVLVLWCGLLLAARDAGRAPPWRLLPLMALWANLHGSFLFGIALAGFLAGEAVLQAGSAPDRRREAVRWGGFALAALVAALLTPNGTDGLLQPFRLMSSPALQSAFIEWLSPDFRAFPALELWLLGALAIGFAGGVRLPPTRLLLLLGLVHMTLQHVRHADLLGLVGPLAIAAPLMPGLGGGTSSLRAGLVRLAAPSAPPGIVASVGIAAALAAPLILHPLIRGDDAVTPASALRGAGELGLSGPVFNSEGFGGYLAFRAVPTFIDGRIEMYGNDFLAEDVAAEHGDPAALAALLDRYGVAWTLLMPQAGAVAVLDHLPGWQRVYADAFAVIHRRRLEPFSGPVPEPFPGLSPDPGR